MFRVMI